MQFSLVFLLLLGLSAYTLAYPYTTTTTIDEPVFNPLYYDDQPEVSQGELVHPEHLHRERRQLNVQGGGSPRQGFDLSINGRAPIWQSPNGRHSLDGTGQYSQHLGGPYGNSRPNWGAGAQYTFRF